SREIKARKRLTGGRGSRRAGFLLNPSARPEPRPPNCLVAFSFNPRPLGVMSSVRVDIISIGALDRNRLWGETQPLRTAHATTTLIRTSKRAILIDPGLPPQALGARLFERTGLRPEQIDTVFLTSFRPEHRSGLSLFANAKWLIHEIEQQSTGQTLKRLIDEAPEDDEDRAAMQAELALLNRLSTPDDRLAEYVDLFPLFG